MASKKRCEFQNIFQQGKKFGGEGASISFAAFEKEGHFCRHSETTVIVSFANIYHKGGNNEGIAFLKGENMGDLMPDFTRSFRRDGHNHIGMRIKGTNPTL